ncbi:YczE/YyaS/YitT family protein [Streptomyces sp. cmx-18-6]|uniref:membrane protein YczE n=1 Tax=Streptomyces sp. cmx-18-6 TaxID=2790930 RepID=UPI00397F3535
MITAGLGVPSWDVLHQGLAHTTGLPFGLVVNGVGVLVLLLWIPLRVRPGVGTLANVLVVGLAADAALSVLPEPDGLAVRIPLLLLGIGLNAFATGLYIGAGLGPGPRDGLMTGLAERGVSLRLARTVIEVVVVAVGWLLGGTVGIGTLLFAVLIGPLAQPAVRRLALDGDGGGPGRGRPGRGRPGRARADGARGGRVRPSGVRTDGACAG